MTSNYLKPTEDDSGFTIITPCYIVIDTNQDYVYEEKQYIVCYNDFMIVDDAELAEQLLTGDSEFDDINYEYSTTLFRCKFILPDEVRIIKATDENLKAIIYYSSDYIGEQIITIEPFVLTAETTMSMIESFYKQVSNIYDPQLIYDKWMEALNLANIKSDSIHAELYIAQTFVCLEDKTKLFRNNKSCKKGKLLNLRQAIKNLYPARALFFEDLGNAITRLPLIEESEMSTLDKMLYGKF